MLFFWVVQKQQIKNKVFTIISEVAGKDPVTLNSQADLVNEIGLDSLDTIEVIMHLEEEFGYSISDEEAEQLNTIDDIVEFIVNKEN